MPSLLSNARLQATLAGLVFLAALATAAVLRLTDLESRPMHTDEAVQAVKMADTVASGVFEYDPHDYHGPGLIFSTIALRKITGQSAAEDLTATSLRLVPALYALLLIASLALFYDGLGRAATATAALFLAVSPIFVYYSRYFIMEVPLVAFTSLFLGCGWRYFRSGKVLWAIAAGASAGLMHVTKETAAISWLATAVGLGFLIVTHVRGGKAPAWIHYPIFMVAVVVGLFVSGTLFSTFFQNGGAVTDSFLTYFKYADRAGGAGHEAPWHTYFTLLTYRKDALIWSEAPLFVLGVIGILSALNWFPFRNPRSDIGNLPRFLAVYTIVTFAIYSIIPYKTPWSILPAYFGVVLLAGFGAVAAFRLIPKPAVSVPLAAAFLISTLWWFQIQNTRANGRFAADSRNPYVYAHTSGDLVKLAERVVALTEFHPDGNAIPVKVYAAPDAGWPLPWYLRNLSKVGYFPNLPESPPDAAVFVVGTAGIGPGFSGLFPESYHSSLYGFRPGVENQAILYIEPALWSRYLDSLTSKPSQKP